MVFPLNGERVAANYRHVYTVSGSANGDFAIQATDRASNAATSQPFTVIYDPVPPFVSLTWPWNGYAQADSHITIRGRSEILSSVVITATRLVDSHTFIKTTTSNALGEWQAVFDLPDGVYALTAQATDRGRNTGPASTPVKITIDTTGPIISHLSFTPVFLQTGHSLTLTATITDALNRISLVQTEVDDQIVDLLSAGGNKYRATLFIDPDVAEGQHKVNLHAWDALDNSTTITGDGFVVDDTPPALSMPTLAISGTNLVLTNTTVYYGPNSSGQITTTIRASDEAINHLTAGLNSLIFPEVFANDAETLTLDGVREAASYSHVYAINGSSKGDFTIEASDRAGNTATSRPFTIIYDNVAPTVVITVPAISGLRFAVEWSGQDEQTGVRSYQVEYRDGTSGAWTAWQSGLGRQAKFVGQDEHTYAFRVRATDDVGNVSEWKESQVAVAAVTKYYLFGSQRVAMRQGSAVFYLHADHLGSASLVTDARGGVVSEVRYLPYGEERWVDGHLPTDFGFTGQRLDSYIKLIHMGARWYDPEIGRFISADSIMPQPGNPQTLNRLAYTLNNPLKYTDPTAIPSPIIRLARVDKRDESCLTGQSAQKCQPIKWVQAFAEVILGLRRHSGDRDNAISNPEHQTPGSYVESA